ncbi:MAG: cytochrome-c peroxidase [Spirochaetales bacterium]|nr:cytochrome-c peroxidase [Leptospiraceae bacterium]MCP5481785.1 cytochrome-c peroxidase [Spirochaetales bacterium]MCP5486901.1 cytochrome-c peroxidase [Spirochaetales bacterium]
MGLSQLLRRRTRNAGVWLARLNAYLRAAAAEDSPQLNRRLTGIYAASATALVAAILLLGWPEDPRAGANETRAAVAEAFRLEPIQPIPLSVPLNANRVDLGRRLFFDARLSRDQSVSCATCHSLQTGGVDRRQVSQGLSGQPGVINAPTVFNSGFNFAQFWDGRAASLEDQINGPVANPVEMGFDWDGIVERLRADPEYVTAFLVAYDQEPTAELVRSAIAEFERSLYTPNARFDRYLRGDRTALTETELEGYGLFKEYGCIACHQGRNVGGNMFQTFGVVGDYFGNRGNLTEADLGRFNVTGEEADRHKFKVPSLRNVALTAPYFHDGTVESLDGAVRTMARYQLGIEMPESDVERIVAFLHTLTGEYGGRSLAESP